MLNYFRKTPLSWAIRRQPAWQAVSTLLHGPKADSPAKAFYGALIDRDEPGCILDIGANIGDKTELFRQLADRVIAIEPDDTVASVMRQRFRGARGVSVRNLAVSDRSGALTLTVFPGFEAYNTVVADWADALASTDKNTLGIALAERRSVTVQATTLQALVEELSPVKFVKIDAEGHEFEIVSTLRQPVHQLSMEFNLPTFRTSLEKSLAHLAWLSSAYRFSACIAEPQVRLECAWLTADELMACIDVRGWTYVEVFCRLQS